MKNNLRRSIIFAAVVISLVSTSVLLAQSVKPAPAAPVPARILAAKKVFIANAGGDERSTAEALYSGGPDRAYNGFYAALKSWGHYELVADPSDADLVFEIQFMVERPVLKGESLTSSDYDPEFRLTIHDPKTNVLLWGITVHAQWALLQGNRDRNFDSALARIVGEVQVLGGGSAASGDRLTQ